MSSPIDSITIFIGSYTQPTGRAKGINRCQFDPTTGALTEPELDVETENPSFLVSDPEHATLFCVNETGTSAWGRTGTVSGFHVRPSGLRQFGAQPSHGTDPCFLTLTPDASGLIVANYSSGTVGAVETDLSSSHLIDELTGSSVVAGRQDGPHAHSAVLHPSGEYFLVADLGSDSIIAYSVSGQRLGETHVEPGNGPRHMVFTDDGKVLFVVNELASSVSRYRVSGQPGVLGHVSTASTLPNGFRDANTCAHLALNPVNGNLYVSNRGHDSIARFAVEDGGLSLVEIVPSGGQTPRNFAVAPDGRWLIVANQDSDNLVVLAIDQATGALRETGIVRSTPSPVCVHLYGV